MLRTGCEDDQACVNRANAIVGKNIDCPNGKVAFSDLMNLAGSKTVSKFKKIARNILIFDHSLETVNEVCRLANHLHHLDGGRKLIQLALITRENLSAVDANSKVNVIKRAFRSSNPTTDIPLEWKRKAERK